MPNFIFIPGTLKFQISPGKDDMLARYFSLFSLTFLANLFFSIPVFWSAILKIVNRRNCEVQNHFRRGCSTY